MGASRTDAGTGIVILLSPVLLLIRNSGLYLPAPFEISALLICVAPRPVAPTTIPKLASEVAGSKPRARRARRIRYRQPGKAALVSHRCHYSVRSG
jgi:hypothetical protein